MARAAALKRMVEKLAYLLVLCAPVLSHLLPLRHVEERLEGVTRELIPLEMRIIREGKCRAGLGKSGFEFEMPCQSDRLQ